VEYVRRDERFTVPEQWTWWVSGSELVPYCASCADREFAPRLTMMDDRAQRTALSASKAAVRATSTSDGLSSEMYRSK